LPKQAKFADKQSFDYPLLVGFGRHRRDAGRRQARGCSESSCRSSGQRFVIDTDRTVLDMIASEVSMDTHADKALKVLRERHSRRDRFWNSPM